MDTNTGRMTEGSPRKTWNTLHAGAATPSSRLAVVGEWNATRASRLQKISGRRAEGQTTEDGAYGPSQTHGLERPCHVEDFARWSRDALVAVGRGWRMKRDEGIASPSNIWAESAGRRIGRKEAQRA